MTKAGTKRARKVSHDSLGFDEDYEKPILVDPEVNDEEVKKL